MRFLIGLIVAGILVLAMNVTLVVVALSASDGDPVVTDYEHGER